MKRLLALLGVLFSIGMLSGCDLFAALDLAEPDPVEEPAEEDVPPEEEGSRAVTLMFAHEVEEGRAALLEAAQQAAADRGYTLTTVTTLGNPELQSRFLELASKAGERAVLLELFDPDLAADVVKQAGEMAVVFVDVAPGSNAALGRQAIYVGNPDGEGEAYLRLTGRTAMLAAINLIEGESAASETGLKLSSHKITVPEDGVLEADKKAAEEEEAPAAEG